MQAGARRAHPATIVSDLRRGAVCGCAVLDGAGTAVGGHGYDFGGLRSATPRKRAR